MRHSLSKTLLALAVFGVFASNSASTNECGGAATSNTALIVNQTECISGNGLYFYIDVENDNTALEIQTSGGTGETDILVDTASWATSANHTQRTNNSGTKDTLSVIANAGRLYVSILGIHQGVTLGVRDSATATGLCSNPSRSNAKLSLGDVRCTSGNDVYYNTYIEQDGTVLTITTEGGSGEADIYVNDKSWATRSNNIASSVNSGTEEALTITANKGDFYISLIGSQEGVTLSLNEGSGNGGDSALCRADTLSDAALTLNQQECISGNNQYFYIDVEFNNTPLIIKTTGGIGEANIYANTGNWATQRDNIASSVNDGTEEILNLTASAGRLYISVFGENNHVSFIVSDNTDDGTDPSDPTIPSLPENPDMCGEDTLVENELTFNQTECVNFSGKSFYTLLIPADNTKITLSTGGGLGEFSLYASQESWPRSDSHDYASSNVGTSESVTFVANKGWLYITLDAGSSDASQVSILAAADISLFPPTDGDSSNDIPDDGFPTDATRFTGLNGAALVERIALSYPQNVNPIYNISGTDATQIYSEANMIAIAKAINSRALGYTGTDTTGLEALLLFLRGSYYVSYAHPDDVPDYTGAVARTTATALRALFNNANTWVASESNGSVLREALITIDSSALGAQFNDITIRVLNEYNADWKASFNMNGAANAVFTTLYRAQWDKKMQALFTADSSILDVLNNFQNKHRDVIGTRAEYVLVNAVNEMARLYHIKTLFPRVKLLVKGVLTTTSKTDNTKKLWIKAGSMADYYDRADCGYYGICGFSHKLETETLTFNYQCSNSLKVRAQHMYNDQGAWICGVLGNQETNFHNILGTGYQPVADDNNEALQLVIFDSSDEYKTYAGLFFKMDTNNGGMYLEGAPGNEKNQARFIAYEAEWKQPDFHTWNLQHEYVHYLDARFDLYGDFTQGMTVSTVWWTEGLAEYIAQGDGNSEAISVGKSQEFKLSEIFNNTYKSGTARVYRWGYLAVRFMFENHRSNVNDMLNLMRTGKYPEFQTYMNNIGTGYDTEFNDWLVNGIILGDSNIVEFGPNNTDSKASGTAGNWPGEPVTISTDFSPCVVDIAASAHDANNNNLVANQVVECINSESGHASFVIRNYGGLSTRFELRTTGGWGNADIMFKADGWPTAQDNDSYANGDENVDSLVIELTPSTYWHYIKLDGEFGGVKLTVTEK
jgi:hypothetical protein